ISHTVSPTHAIFNTKPHLSDQPESRTSPDYSVRLRQRARRSGSFWQKRRVNIEPADYKILNIELYIRYDTRLGKAIAGSPSHPFRNLARTWATTLNPLADRSTSYRILNNI